VANYTTIPSSTSLITIGSGRVTRTRPLRLRRRHRPDSTICIPEKYTALGPLGETDTISSSNQSSSSTSVLDHLHHRHSPFLDVVLTRSGMVSCCLFILLIAAAFNQLRLAREGIREPTIVFEIDRILSHTVFADMHSLSPQSISLVACCARTSSVLSDKGPREVTRDVA
jgi:hypothetical protein